MFWFLESAIDLEIVTPRSPLAVNRVVYGPRSSNRESFGCDSNNYTEPFKIFQKEGLIGHRVTDIVLRLILSFIISVILFKHFTVVIEFLTYIRIGTLFIHYGQPLMFSNALINLPTQANLGVKAPYKLSL
jgi:hypothetical protein